MKTKLQNRIVAAACVVATILFTACGSITPKGAMENLEVSEFAEIVQKGDTTVIINVEGDQYGDIIIEGAISFPINNEQDAQMVIEQYGVATPYAVYDLTGVKSAKAAKLLSDKGAIVYNLKPGLMGWVEADQEIIVMPLDSTMTAPVKTSKSKLQSDPAMMQKMVDKMTNK